MKTPFLRHIPGACLRRMFCLSVCIARLCVSLDAQTGEIVILDTISPDARNLAYLAHKIRNGEPVRMGFIGGSITQGAGVKRHSDSYYWKTQMRLVTYAGQYGAAAESKLAAVGGTGSDYGSYRLGVQLLDQPLDLLVVEFAVNDYQNPVALDGMEGIVRQTLVRNPRAVIVLFYTVNRRMLAECYDKGTLPASVVAFHKVAEHYNLIEVHAGPVVQALLANGGETLDTFFKDHSHPLAVGHAFYADMLGESLINALDVAATVEADATAPGLPDPVGAGDYERASLQPLEPVEQTGEWTHIDRGYYTYFGQWKSTQAGDSLSFDVKGKRIALLCGRVTGLHVVGPGFEKNVSYGGKRNGIPGMQVIYDGPEEISGRVTVMVEPGRKGDAEVNLAGLAIITAE